MQIDYAHICDYAMISREGKISIVGIFARIHTAQVPAAHPQFFVCAQFTIEDGDQGRTHPVSLRILDPEGQEMLARLGEVVVSEDAPLQPLAMHFRIDTLEFPAFGPYDIRVEAAGSLKQMTLQVERLPDVQS